MISKKATSFLAGSEEKRLLEKSPSITTVGSLSGMMRKRADEVGKGGRRIP